METDLFKERTGGEEAQIYSVTSLTRDIRYILEDKFPEVWVEGEVSNFVTTASGHSYFSLKDENSVINCVMFKSSGSRLKFAVENGLRVLCYGRVSVYDKRGQYQLYVNKIEPRGRGALQLAYEQLKNTLHKEGLFDESLKKPLPVLPARIGIVTSPTGAVIRDILKVVGSRFANVEVTLRPVKVQGDGAKDEIALAIEELNELNAYIKKSGSEENLIDVIIVGRGGGSLEDLWPFNEEIVARAIYESVIPIVSAVGHEVDYTISDFVSDLRAPTPSAAAEMVMPLKSDLLESINGLRLRMNAAVRTRMNIFEKEVESLKDSYILRSPMNAFLQREQQVDELLKKITSKTKHYLELVYGKVNAYKGKLSALSPMGVLDRGYSITFKDGKVVKEASVLKKNDVLLTRLAKGSVTSKVEPEDG